MYVVLHMVCTLVYFINFYIGHLNKSWESSSSLNGITLSLLSLHLDIYQEQ